MTEFEILSVPIFFVLGLGITKILGGVGSAIRRGLRNFVVSDPVL